MTEKIWGSWCRTSTNRVCSRANARELNAPTSSRDNVGRYENYAVFEIPLILDRVMATKAMESWQAPSTLAHSIHLPMSHGLA